MISSIQLGYHKNIQSFKYSYHLAAWDWLLTPLGTVRKHNSTWRENKDGASVQTQRIPLANEKSITSDYHKLTVLLRMLREPRKLWVFHLGEVIILAILCKLKTYRLFMVLLLKLSICCPNFNGHIYFFLVFQFAKINVLSILNLK